MQITDRPGAVGGGVGILAAGGSALPPPNPHHERRRAAIRSTRSHPGVGWEWLAAGFRAVVRCHAGGDEMRVVRVTTVTVYCVDSPHCPLEQQQPHSRRTSRILWPALAALGCAFQGPAIEDQDPEGRPA